MTCDDLELLLDRDPAAALDDGSAARRHADDHAAGCPRCAARLEAARALRRETRRLAAGTAPARDLWPAVRARLAPRPAPWWRRAATRLAGVLPPTPAWALAAAVVACALGLVLGLATWTSPVTAPPGLTAGGDAAASRTPSRREAAAADATLALLRRDLDATLARPATGLDPATRAEVERSLSTVRQAIGELRLALDQSPDSVPLNHLLAANYRREVDILKRLNRL